MARNTVQRQIILEATLSLDIHPTVEDVFEEIHKRHPTISKTTVYRNLRQLADDGEIRQILIPDGSERFDKRADQHFHFKCKTCDAIFDIDADYQKEMDEAVRRKYGFQVDAHDVVFRGVCINCSGGVYK